MFSASHSMKLAVPPTTSAKNFLFGYTPGGVWKNQRYDGTTAVSKTVTFAVQPTTGAGMTCSSVSNVAYLFYRNTSVNYSYAVRYTDDFLKQVTSTSIPSLMFANSAPISSTIYLFKKPDAGYDNTSIVYSFNGSSFTSTGVSALDSNSTYSSCATLSSNIYFHRTSGFKKFDGSAWTDLGGFTPIATPSAACTVGSNIHTFAFSASASNALVYNGTSTSTYSSAIIDGVGRPYGGVLGTAVKLYTAGSSHSNKIKNWETTTLTLSNDSNTLIDDVYSGYYGAVASLTTIDSSSYS